MKRTLLIAILLTTSLSAAPLREYSFIVFSNWLQQFGIADTGQGNLIEVFVGDGQPNTSAYRVSARYQNGDGSVGVVSGIFDRSSVSDTLCPFRAPGAVKIIGVTVEELASQASQEFVN